MDVKPRSQFLLRQGVMPCLVERGRGAIIDFAKPSARAGGSAVSRVRTNVLCPGTADTPMTPDTLTGERPRSAVREAPMGRPAKPPEIADGGPFPASDLASFANKTMLTVDGGASVRP